MDTLTLLLVLCFSNIPSDIIKEDHSVTMASSLIRQTLGLGCESVFRQGLLSAVWFSVYPLDYEEGCFFSSVVTLFYFRFRSSSSSFGCWFDFCSRYLDAFAEYVYCTNATRYRTPLWSRLLLSLSRHAFLLASLFLFVLFSFYWHDPWFARALFTAAGVFHGFRHWLGPLFLFLNLW